MGVLLRCSVLKYWVLKCRVSSYWEIWVKVARFRVATALAR
jgi:hypothetical protein